MPEAAYKKRVRNPDNNEQYFDVPLVGEWKWKFGSQRGGMTFSNKDENDPTTRKVHPKTITHKAEGPEGSPPPEDGDVDDENQKVEVEVIDEFTIKGRIVDSLGVYHPTKHTYATEQDKEKSGRKTHIKRIKGTIEGKTLSGWIDIERSDKQFFTHGSGFPFRRQSIEPVWKDEQDPNPFDTADVEIVDDSPANGFDPPWRLDPLQKIVNVKWGGDQPPPWIAINIWVYRRVKTDAMTDIVAWDVAINTGLISPIQETLLSYSKFFPWPFSRALGGPAVEPFDIPKENGIISVRGWGGEIWGFGASPTTLTGMPELGVSTAGAGVTTGVFEDEQSVVVTTPTPGVGGRFGEVMGGAITSPFGPTPFVPIYSTGIPAVQFEASTTVQFELYEVSESQAQHSGATVGSVDMDFSGFIGEWDGYHYAAVGAKEEPFPDGEGQVRTNHLNGQEYLGNVHRGEVWILLELQDPPPGYVWPPP